MTMSATQSANRSRRIPGPRLILLAAALALIGSWCPTAHADQPAATAPADLATKASPAEAEAILTPVQPTETPQPEPAAPSAGQDSDQMEVLIIQALDQPTNLNVQEVPIRQAIDQLAAETGIPIQLAPPCLSLLPYGSQTKLSATIQQRPLGESLTALLRPLGLHFAPTPGELLIYPAPPLARIGRRATWEELGLLEKLASQPMTPDLFATFRFQFQDPAATDADANRDTLGALVRSVGDGPADQVLEHACDQHGWTWHPDGSVIVVLTKVKQIERQLQSRATLRYVQTALSEALADLGNRAGVLVRFDPGVLASLPPQTAERFSLFMENATLNQALELITGETGLSYLIEPDGVRITHPGARGPATGPAGAATPSQVEAAAQATAAALRSNAIVGQLSYPLPDGSSFAFFIRESDLPPEVNAMRLARIAKTVNQIRQKLHGEQQQD